NFNNLLDSAEKLTAEQKALLKDGKMRLQMNMKEKLFKIDMNIPYKDFATLQKLLETSGSNSAMTEAMDEIFNQKKDEKKADEPANEKAPDLGGMTNFYTVTVKKGLISKQVDQEKFKELMAKPEMAQMSQLTS